MMDYSSRHFERGREIPITLEEGNVLLRRSFLWMLIGVGLTAITSYLMIYALATKLINPGIFFIATIISMIAEFILVIVLSTRVYKMSVGGAKTTFIIFSILNGISLSIIHLAYPQPIIHVAFLSAAIFFGVMAAYGYFTKADLSRLGNILLGGLIGLIIASLVNAFLFPLSTKFNLIVSFIGVAIFLGLTAYDVQRIKFSYLLIRESAPSLTAAETDAIISKAAIAGALSLYLDFINLFLYILRILGARRD